MLTALGVAAVITFIAANALFVAAEFSFVAARRSHLEDAAKLGDRRAQRAVAIHQRLSFMLSGAQLGITVTSLAVGFIAEPVFGRALGPVMGWVGVPEGARFATAVTAGFVITTAVQMVLGELAPKNLAIAKPEPVARATATAMAVYLRVTGPIIRLFDSSANGLLRAFGVEAVEELRGGVSVEELDLIVEESAERGKLPRRQAALIERAIDFSTLTASDAMVPWNRVETLDVNDTCERLRTVTGEGHSRFPVLEGDMVAGVVHAKDLLDVGDLSSIRVGTLTHQALVVPETARLRTVLRKLRSNATAMAVVADEHGAPAGIVTFEDLVEELVGEIDDEYDTEHAAVEQLPDGTCIVPGSHRLDEIARACGVELPEDPSYSTVAGLVLSRLERLAVIGDQVDIAGAVIEVTDVDGWGITEVHITPPDGSGTGEAHT